MPPIPSKRTESSKAVESPNTAHTLFDQLEVFSVEYDNLKPGIYDAGTFIGFVVKRENDRMKLVFCYEIGPPNFSWLKRHDKGRWIDQTWTTIVSVEEASISQREALRHWVSPQQLAQLLSNA